MHTEYDVIVAGAGSFGMSAGYQLAKRGVRVLLIDAGDPPHTQGSHHGSTRIVRTAYTMGASYVKLALQAQVLWKQLEAESAELRASSLLCQGPLFSPTGVVSIGQIGSSFIKSKTKSCIEFGIPHRTMTAAMLRTEWSGVYVPDDMEGLYEPEAGVLFSERIIQVYRQLALHHGAGLMPYTTVSSIERGVTGHVVHTSAGTFTAQNVLVASGAWIGRILPELASRVTPVRKPIAWFEAPLDRYGADKLPAFIINNGGDEEYFGFPDFDGSGLKIGRHDGGHIPLHGQPLPIFGTFEEDVEELRYALDRFLPDVGGLVRGQVCLYERTSDERILLGEVPGRPGVWFAGGGSGHGFKFASVIGEAISLAMMKGMDSVDLDWQTFSLEGVL